MSLLAASRPAPRADLPSPGVGPETANETFAACGPDVAEGVLPPRASLPGT